LVGTDTSTGWLDAVPVIQFCENTGNLKASWAEAVTVTHSPHIY